MALDISSPAVSAAIMTTRTELSGGDFTAASLALQQAITLQEAHLADIAAAQTGQSNLLSAMKRGIAAVITLRDLLE
jgi:hypothetical protein